MNTNQIKQWAATFSCAAMLFAVGCSKDAGVEDFAPQGGSIVGDAPTLLASVVQPSTRVTSQEGTDCIEFSWEVDDVVSIYSDETKVAEYEVTAVDDSSVATLEYVEGSSTVKDLDLSSGSYTASYKGANVGKTLAYDATTSYIGKAIELSTEEFEFTSEEAVTFKHKSAFLGFELDVDETFYTALEAALQKTMKEELEAEAEDGDPEIDASDLDVSEVPLYICVSNLTETKSYKAISLLYSELGALQGSTLTLPVAAAESWEGIYVALASDAVAATTIHSERETTLNESVTFEAGVRKLYDAPISLALPSVLTCDTLVHSDISADGDTIEVTFTSNGAWTVAEVAENPVGMITLPDTTTGTASPDLGQEQTFSIVISENKTDDPRSGSITISQTDATDITIQFNQAVSGGDSAEDPIVLNKAKLIALATGVNDGTITTSGVYYQLGEDIELDGEWTPLGNSETHPFSGHLDGNSKTISGLSITTDMDYAGFIGVMNGGSISNLTVKGAINIVSTAATSTTQKKYVGGIIAYMPITPAGVSIYGDLVSEVNVDYSYASTETYKGADLSIGGAFGLFSCTSTSMDGKDGVVPTITSGAADGSNHVNVDAYTDFMWVGGVMGAISASNAPKPTLASAVVLTSNMAVTSHSYPTASITTVMNHYTGGVVGYLTFAAMDKWRAVMNGGKIHAITSPCSDGACTGTAIRWVCTGGFVGYNNAVNGFRTSTAADVSASTDIVVELDDSMIGEGTMFGSATDPLYKLCVGTFTGQKSPNVGTNNGATMTENKAPNGNGGIAGTAVARNNNYFKLYDEAAVKGMLSTAFQMSQSGYGVTSATWDTYYHAYTK